MKGMMEHHALLFSDTNPLVCNITEQGYDVHFECRQSKFGIDDVRALIQTAHRRPQGTDTQVQTLLVATEFVTEEAQHALLKLIEEPPATTRFIFLIPEGYRFLPTLESRFMRPLVGGVSSEGNSVFDAFQISPVGQRLEAIETALKVKDTAWQYEIKQGLGTLLNSPTKTYKTATLRELSFIQRTLLTRGASNKFLLEHLALIL
jgi:hypothetical protein